MTCEPPIPQRSEPRPDFARISPTRHETDRTTGLHHAWRRGLGPRLRRRDGASNAKFVRRSPRARPSRRSSARLSALPRIRREPPLTRGRRRRLLNSAKAQLFPVRRERGGRAGPSIGLFEKLRKEPFPTISRQEANGAPVSPERHNRR